MIAWVTCPDYVFPPLECVSHILFLFILKKSVSHLSSRTKKNFSVCVFVTSAPRKWLRRKHVPPPPYSRKNAYFCCTYLTIRRPWVVCFSESCFFPYFGCCSRFSGPLVSCECISILLLLSHHKNSTFIFRFHFFVSTWLTFKKKKENIWRQIHFFLSTILSHIFLFSVWLSSVKLSITLTIFSPTTF